MNNMVYLPHLPNMPTGFERNLNAHQRAKKELEVQDIFCLSFNFYLPRKTLIIYITLR